MAASGSSLETTVGSSEFSLQFMRELAGLGVETVSAQQLEQQLEAEATAQIHNYAVYGDRRVQAAQQKIKLLQSEIEKLERALKSEHDKELHHGLNESLKKKRDLLDQHELQLKNLISANQRRAEVQGRVQATVSVRFDDALSSAIALNSSVLPASKRRKLDESSEDSIVDIDDSGESQPSVLHLAPASDRDEDHKFSDSDDQDFISDESTDLPSALGDDLRDTEFAKRVAAFVPDDSTLQISSEFIMRASLFHSLFEHQRICVRWLWELHQQRCGGIIGDEMGLGKTLETIAFLDGLAQSNLLHRRPCLVVCPATVLRQWLREFQTWSPQFRVMVYHPSFRKSNESLSSVLKKCINSAAHSTPTVVITTYEMVRTQSSTLVSNNANSGIPSWIYVILDEGHKLRNPEAKITTICKQFETPHRIVLTGAPIQNNLNELWSLFDLIFPGKLGTQEMFDSQFAAPILKGGYSNATPFEARMAYKCALVLRDLIKPFLLRRLKKDVQIQLPEKSEQVLFCRLTSIQRAEYLKFLSSKDAKLVFLGKKNMLFGVDILRKICNHPFLLDNDKGFSRLSTATADQLRNIESHEPDIDYGSVASYLASFSTKLKVLQHTLRLWWDESQHKVLVFAQTRQMLDIIESFIKSLGYQYLRMDGNTPIPRRAQLIDSFNASPPSEIFIFLLTTRVGGLGVNLTAADKVVIFDPDWNPVTDLQARERSYRIGQTRQVTIYRLVTLGTIEEKIYQRQIFKQFLTNRILLNPSQTKSLFKSSDLKELFRFDEQEHNQVESTGATARAQPPPQTQTTHSQPELSEEDTILHELLGDSLHSRLNHDKLVGESNGSDKSFEEEAQKIATAAVQRLRASRQTQAEKAWRGSGRFGNTSRAPPATSRDGSTDSSARSSDALLLNMRTSSAFGMSSADQDALLRDLYAYLEKHNGTCSSQELVATFSQRVNGPDSLRIFKGLLQQIATLNKTSRTWFLKVDF